MKQIIINAERIYTRLTREAPVTYCSIRDWRFRITAAVRAKFPPLQGTRGRTWSAASDIDFPCTDRSTSDKMLDMPTALLMREQVRDDNVALAALFFDRVNIIFPKVTVPLRGMEPPTRLMRDLERLGIVEFRNLEPDQAESTGVTILKSIENLRDQLRERYAFDGEAWPRSGGRAYTVHAPWYPTALKDALLEEGLAFHKINAYQQ